MTGLEHRSIRTLAWLGDVEFEREVRYRVAHRGDYPTDRLDAMKSCVVKAESQARLLEQIEARLQPEEQAVVRRARNAALPSSARGRRKTQAYRSATALEALIAHWWLRGAPGHQRFDELLSALLDEAIDAAVDTASHRLRRG